MLRVLERVVGPHSRFRGRGSKLKGAVSSLREEAYQWWLSVEEGTQPDRLNWKFLNTAFRGKYVGASYVDARRHEFMNLTHGDRSVAEYKAKFLRLNSYAQGMVASEDREFAILVDKAKIAEEVKHVECQNRDRERGNNKRDSEPSSSFERPKKWARPDEQDRALCSFGGQFSNHLGAVDRLGRDAHDVITGRLFIFNVPYTALIDIGSTHSYVASTITENLGISVESTSSEITALSSVGQSVRLVEHRVTLDCTTKWVVLRTEDDKEVVMIGERRDYLSNVISALVAEKLVRKGCEAYLAYVGVSFFGDSSVGDIRITREFPDVFPKKLPGLPSNREVEFDIELLSGTAPVSIAPYLRHRKILRSLRLNFKSF
ncbi:alcohol-forming fatty acyl-CoA reductase-like [Gossypium australe]|uniref:Alcohol-forming fatty acyl-CoA reductase-like n=1 Tax=Gossypium australe TaxID=47621 RepID=A0A5B6W7M8_9ROSI|nr:alcohol-forming fatty acyl-CoA reductase-like [Gossypium australe]